MMMEKEPLPKLRYSRKDYLNVTWEIEDDYKKQLSEEAGFNSSFRKVFSKKEEHDLTESIVKKTLYKKMYGKRTGHFIIIIKGLEGVTSTGVGKSSAGQILASIFEPGWKVRKRLGFTNDQVLDLVKEQDIVTDEGAEGRYVFVRDETPKTLRQRAEAETETMIEALRDSCVSIVLIKPVNIDLTIAHYVFVPIAFSMDFKWIKLAVFNPNRDYYRGFVVLPIDENNKNWRRYMKMKKKYQKDVTKRKHGVFDHVKYAKKFATDYKEKLFSSIKQLSNGKEKLVKMRVMKHINDEYPGFTVEEKTYIYDDIEEWFQDGSLFMIGEENQDDQ